MIRPVALLLALGLAGCGAYDAHRARDPYGPVIGMSVLDLRASLGTPSAPPERLSDDQAMIQYEFKDVSTAFKASVTLLGSIELGGGGQCRVVFRIARRGYVMDVALPLRSQDSLFSAPYDACDPLLAELIRHRSDSGVPAGYDAFEYLFPKDKP